QKAFQGDSKMSTLAAIIKQDPKPVRQLVQDIPPDLGKIINRCLRKDPQRRFHYFEDLKVELEELKEESDSGTDFEKRPVVQPLRRTWFWVGAAVAVAAITVAAWLFRGTP